MTSTRSPIGRAAPVLAAAVAVAFALAGCSGGAQRDSASTASGRGEKAVAPAAQQPDAGAQPGGANYATDAKNPAKDPLTPVTANRSIIHTGTITMRVEHPDQAAGEVSVLAIGANGFVAADQRSNDGSRSEARVVVRVPADKFDSTLDSISHIRGGNQEGRSVDTQDVTEQMVDLDVRIANGQASVDRVRALMARAQTIAEIVSLESELARREGDLESLKARKAKLDDTTALSTITAVLLGPDAKAAPTKSKIGFVAGLVAGWRAFVGSMQILLTLLGALLPWLLAIGLLLAAFLAVRRRSRRPREPKITVPLAPAQTAPAHTADEGAPGPS
jgi:hypothetical protein